MIANTALIRPDLSLSVNKIKPICKHLIITINPHQMTLTGSGQRWGTLAAGCKPARYCCHRWYERVKHRRVSHSAVPAWRTREEHRSRTSVCRQSAAVQTAEPGDNVASGRPWNHSLASPTELLRVDLSPSHSCTKESPWIFTVCCSLVYGMIALKVLWR